MDPFCPPCACATAGARTVKRMATRRAFDILSPFHPRARSGMSVDPNTDSVTPMATSDTTRGRAVVLHPTLPGRYGARCSGAARQAAQADFYHSTLHFARGPDACFYISIECECSCRIAQLGELSRSAENDCSGSQTSFTRRWAAPQRRTTSPVVDLPGWTTIQGSRLVGVCPAGASTVAGLRKSGFFWPRAAADSSSRLVG